MSRPPSDRPAHNKIQSHLTDDELAALDDWRFARRIGSRAEAIRQLIAKGLSAEIAAIDDWLAEQGRRGRSEAIQQLIARGLTAADEAPPEPQKKRAKRTA